MTGVLVRKLLRDVRVGLALVALLLGAFQCLWAKITQRILGELAPFLNTMAASVGLNPTDVEKEVFAGPGKIVRTLIGGEAVDLNTAMDVLTIGYVHPVVQTILCVWAVGRASGAVAGETDRGTSELLLAQPMPRSRLVLAHLCVDLLVIPVLALSMWAGTALGVTLTGPIEEKKSEVFKDRPPGKAQKEQRLWELLQDRRFQELLRDQRVVDLMRDERFKELMKDGPLQAARPENAASAAHRLETRPEKFGLALPSVGGLLFAISGYTMLLSSLGRYRWRVLGVAVLITLLQFLVNLLGQMWDVIGPLRPFTVFYYYQPQQMILGSAGEALRNLLVLYAVGAAGYLLAFFALSRRDIPAPL